MCSRIRPIKKHFILAILKTIYEIVPQVTIWSFYSPHIIFKFAVAIVDSINVYTGPQECAGVPGKYS
jgi:hypothetical protein